MLSGRKILFLGGLIYLVFLAAFIPSGIIARQIERQTGERILFSSEKGTLWNGAADILIIDANGAISRRLGSVSWRFRAVDLLVGKVGFNFEFADKDVMAEGVLRPGVGSVQFKDVKAELPAYWLARFHGALSLWQPGGKLVLNAMDFGFTADDITGKGALRWLNASSALVAEPLGNYRVNLEGKGQGIALSLATEQGLLDLSGVGNWSRQDGLTFDGMARKHAGADGLDEFLQIIGPAQGDGTHVIRIRG